MSFTMYIYAVLWSNEINTKFEAENKKFEKALYCNFYDNWTFSKFARYKYSWSYWNAAHNE